MKKASWVRKVVRLLWILAASCGSQAWAQVETVRDDASREVNIADRGEPMSSRERLDLLKDLGQALRETYVFPDRVGDLITALETSRTQGLFDLAEPAALADRLTSVLRAVHGDAHLLVRLVPDETSEIGTYDPMFARHRGIGGNYGFSETRILDGNVGYLRLSSFSLDELFEEAKPTVAAAFDFLRNVDAMIVDVRGNGGGSARLPAYVASYFYGDEPVHFNDFYLRPQEQTLEMWTSPDAPGSRLAETPLVILIDRDTFSAAEGFAYGLKHLGRAKIVGERSAGGSHGGSMRRLSPRFEAYIPYSRSIHPVTKTDFEGTGVRPHLECESEDATHVGHRWLLNRLISAGSNPAARAWWQRALDRLAPV